MSLNRSHIQIRIDDEALQALQAAGTSHRQVLETLIKEDVDRFERELQERAEPPMNGPLDKFERAILQTYLLARLMGRPVEMRSGDSSST